MAHLPSPLLTTARLIAGGPLNAASSRSDAVGLLVVDKAEEAPAADGNDSEGALGGTEGEVDDGEETFRPCGPCRRPGGARRGRTRAPEERGTPLRRLPRRAGDSSAAPTTVRLSRWRPLPRRRCSRPSATASSAAAPALPPRPRPELLPPRAAYANLATLRAAPAVRHQVRATLPLPPSPAMAFRPGGGPYCHGCCTRPRRSCATARWRRRRPSLWGTGRQGHERRGASGSKLAPGRQTHYNALLEGLLATARLLRHMADGGVARNHRTSTPKCSCVLACWPA
ncbi:LOW QUALITY PROTEIN: hypothetical protein BDA96_01G141600 [Sorghum bicolor]|uniref:Uncharacterized protein n=2 Tax=Sorghum bicolor TaxID=4558 RepID=A0A921RYL9_SORBI|nr:LOW QUALITY PROTEIN: hypothetical protein SORBI_3001G135800 [Sorghum bicolor]KAG0548146.1 LOW QUALITY PROTEIN: hypothetical protein BDA96_01G141600 [Sorghum bicolor]